MDGPELKEQVVIGGAIAIIDQIIVEVEESFTLSLAPLYFPRDNGQ
jgi:hypothetical protein